MEQNLPYAVMLSSNLSETATRKATFDLLSRLDASFLLRCNRSFCQIFDDSLAEFAELNPDKSDGQSPCEGKKWWRERTDSVGKVSSNRSSQALCYVECSLQKAVMKECVRKIARNNEIQNENGGENYMEENITQFGFLRAF